MSATMPELGDIWRFNPTEQHVLLDIRTEHHQKALLCDERGVASDRMLCNFDLPFPSEPTERWTYVGTVNR